MTPEIIPTSYNTLLVLLSFLIATIGSFTALTAASSMRSVKTGLDRFNIFLAGLALGGIAIWSMHFIGMVAWKVEIGVGYRLLETVVSLVAAVIVSTIALGYMASGPLTWRRLLIAGPLTGIGVAVMHYMGMYSMRFSGYFDWNIGIVALSVLIAMVAATAALWLAFNTRQRLHRMAAAVVMGAAVCTMHYTGMGAASVVCTSRGPNAALADLLRPADLPAVVIFVAIGVVLMISLDLLLQRLNAATPAVTPALRRR